MLKCVGHMNVGNEPGRAEMGGDVLMSTLQST